ncbi:uncharacterized protein LOC141912103 [Tubulanus polymorphus]|uniref:uncharacterized protein LOC141912103 n=1 Tax=Tubulanus polymorphus TaxID=672921 RepID=UPI003DA5B660
MTVVLGANSVYGYYCDSGRCGEEEYCCGDNKCCTSYMVWQNWYFWFGLVFFLILLSACASFWKYRLTYYGAAIVIQGGNQPYSRLQHDDHDDDIRLPMQGSMFQGSHVNLPPAYAKYSHKKTSTEYSPPPPYTQVEPPDGPPPPYSS